jgi:hypothetical protein
MAIRCGAPEAPPNNCLERETRFGAYSVVLRCASELSEWVRRGLGLAESDSYIEVHVPDSVTGGPTAVLGAFKDGVVELADFLIEKGLSPKCLVGLTHQNVARPAQRFLNFQVLIGIPDEAVNLEKTTRIDRGYSLTKRAADGVPRGPLCLCYQTYESFMDFTAALRSRHGELANSSRRESRSAGGI